MHCKPGWMQINRFVWLLFQRTPFFSRLSSSTEIVWIFQFAVVISSDQYSGIIPANSPIMAFADALSHQGFGSLPSRTKERLGNGHPFHLPQRTPYDKYIGVSPQEWDALVIRDAATGIPLEDNGELIELPGWAVKTMNTLLIVSLLAGGASGGPGGVQQIVEGPTHSPDSGSSPTPDNGNGSGGGKWLVPLTASFTAFLQACQQALTPEEIATKPAVVPTLTTTPVQRFTSTPRSTSTLMPLPTVTPEYGPTPEGATAILTIDHGYVAIDTNGNPMMRFADPDGPGGEPGQWVEAQAVEEGEDGRWSFWNRDMGTWQTPEEQADRVEKINGRTLVFQEGRYRPVYEYDTGAGELKSFVPKAAKVCQEFTFEGKVVNDCDVFPASSFVPIDEAQIKPMFTQNEDGEMVPATLGRFADYDMNFESKSIVTGDTGYIRDKGFSCVVRGIASWPYFAYENTIKVLCETVTPGGDSFFFPLIMADQPGQAHGIQFFEDDDVGRPIGRRSSITYQDMINWFLDPAMNNQQIMVTLQMETPGLLSLPDVIEHNWKVFQAIEAGKMEDILGKYPMTWDVIYLPARIKK